MKHGVPLMVCLAISIMISGCIKSGESQTPEQRYNDYMKTANSEFQASRGYKDDEISRNKTAMYSNDIKRWPLLRNAIYEEKNHLLNAQANLESACKIVLETPGMDDKRLNCMNFMALLRDCKIPEADFMIKYTEYMEQAWAWEQENGENYPKSLKDACNALVAEGKKTEETCPLANQRIDTKYLVSCPE